MTLVDISISVTPEMVANIQGEGTKPLIGHLGTHFDVMDKEFPLDFVEREAVVFDIRNSKDREITREDIDPDLVKQGMFVAFYSGFAETEGYSTPRYTREHPQLAVDLLEWLVSKGISIIGIDFAGVRRGKEHGFYDQYCADKGVFIIENLCNLDKILRGHSQASFVANTYPVRFEGVTGLPCRVVAKV